MNEVESSYSNLSHVEKRLFAKNAGKQIEAASKCIIPFYKVVPNQVTEDDGRTYEVKDDDYFVSMCIRSLFENEDENGKQLPIEEMISKARQSKKLTSLESYDKKISALMNSSQTEIFSLKLAKLMKYTADLLPGYYPDCDRLYRDLCQINNTHKYVQKRWAKKIYTE